MLWKAGVLKQAQQMGLEDTLQITVPGQLSGPKINFTVPFDRFHSVFLGVFVVLYICFIPK